jgi:Chaperone of endosialidase
MAFNRELSQFAAYLDLDAAGKYIGITPAESTTNVGIGRTNPNSKLEVVGDVKISGVATATTFYGNLDYSYITNKTSGVRTEFSVVDNGGDGSLTYNNVTGIISYVGPSASDARAHFSAASSNLGSLTYSAETGVFTYSGVTTANIRDQFSASSADIGLLSYNSTTGTLSLSGVTTSTIRDQFSGGTGVTITNGSVAIGQPVGTSDNVTFGAVNSTGIVTAAQFKTGASGEAIGINTNTISGPATITIDPAAVGDNTGLVVIKGDLQIDGTTTSVNSTTVTVDDLNITLADGAINDAAANGGGFTVQSGEGNKTFQFEATGDNFGSSENMNLASGKVYKINNTEVLSGTTLGSNVVNSSLTSVGTLTKLDVGNVNSTGIVTASGGFSGNVTGNVTGNVIGDVTGTATTATNAVQLQTARTISLTGDVVGEVSFNGTSNVSIAATIQPNSVGLGTDTTGDYVATIADSGSSDIVVSNSGTETAAVTLGLSTTGVSAGSYGSASAIPTFTVDSRGRLTTAGSVNVATALTVTGDSGSEIINLGSESLAISGGTNLTSSAASNTVTVNLDDNISLTSVVASGVVTATSGFVGDLTGTATTATNLSNAANITTGTIDDARLPDLITSNINITSGVSTFATIQATTFEGSFTGTATTASVATYAILSGVSTSVIGGISSVTQLQVTGISTFTNGPVLIGSGTSTGTESQSLQITGGAYVSGNLGIGTTNPAAKLHVVGDAKISNDVYVDIIRRNTDNSTNTKIALDAGSLKLYAGNGITPRVTINGGVGINTDLNVTGVITASSFSGNASSATYATTAGVATALQNARTFEITGDVVASAISFDGSGNVSLAATIQPNSVGLGTDTTGDYVRDITGTANQITVTSGTGEGSTPTLSIPNQFTAPQDVTVTRDLQVDRNLNVNGNITIGGTSATLFTTELKISDPDIVLGFRTDGSGNDISNDTTANHGGVALASTEGTPLVDLFIAGIETAPATYKKIMWFKSGTFSGLGTDAWLSNYAVGIGSTQFPTGTRLAAGSVQFTENDLAVVRNISASGIITATSGFVGNLTGNVTGNINSSGVSTISSLSATNINASGIVTASSFVGAFTGTATSTTNIPNLTGAITSNNTTTSLGSFTSAQLATALTDETGTGANVFATSPTLVTPVLGTPSSGTLTNCTGLPISGLTASTSTALGVGSIELGHASDTSITRVSAGVVAIEGVNVVTVSSTDTLTNKTLTSPTLTTPNIGAATGTSLNLSGICTALDFNTTSDINFKTNIQPIENPLKKVLQINGVEFNWKEDNRPSMGVIAQEIEKVLPQLVSDGDRKTVNYNGLIGLLIEAVKDLSRQVEELKSTK